MQGAFSLNSPMQSIIQLSKYKLINDIIFVLIGVVFLAIISQASIPLKPVPITLQSVSVLLIGMLYGARLGWYTIASYLIAGASGMPIFAEMHFGVPVFLGPTGGYLIGFLFGGSISGYLVQQGWGRNVLSSFFAILLGNSIIFLFGLAVLAISIGLEKAYLVGLKPFICTELLKMIVVALIIPKFWKIK